MDSGTVDSTDSSVSSTRTRILAYLGQLRAGEYVPAKKLCNDLRLRFTTAKNTLTLLEERGLVEKQVTTARGTVASFRIAADACTVSYNKDGSRRLLPYCPPEWSDAYGKHPNSV
jgi:predicted ArsR family transcriptional regulator